MWAGRRDTVQWGAPRVHAELLKLGVEIAQATVAKHLRRPTKPPSQSWRTFLITHASQLASMDFFTVPTATFRVLVGTGRGISRDPLVD